MILLPQMPVKNRYPEDWIEIWERELSKLDMEVTTLGDRRVRGIDRSKPYNYFTNTREAVKYECRQIISLMDRKGFDTVLWLDINFPGMSAIASQILRLMNPQVKIYGYLHAGSWCNGDIWTSVSSRRAMEEASFQVFDKIFVASQYHKNKIEQYFNKSFPNLLVVGLPFYKQDVLKYVGYQTKSLSEKSLVFLNGRPEQSDAGLVSYLVKHFPNEQFVSGFDVRTRKDYCTLLNNAKVVVSLKTEETFGLGVLEAAALGCITLCPKNFAYTELLPEPLLYKDKDELVEKLRQALSLKTNPWQVNLGEHEKAISRMVEVIRAGGGK